MRKVAVLLVTLVWLTGCSSLADPAALGSVPIESTAVEVSVSEVLSTTTTAVLATTTTLRVDEVPIEYPIVDEPVELDSPRSFQLPAGYRGFASGVGPDDVVVAALFSEDSIDPTPYIWSSVSEAPQNALDLLNAELGEDAYWGATVEWFDGRWYVFLAGDPDAGDVTPTVLVSDDAVNWSRLDLIAQVQSALTRAYTPGWPYGGASAVMSTDTTADQIVAAGWATVGGGVVPVVWTSQDGTTWTVKILRVFDPIACADYGSNVAASDNGVFVDVFGCTYYGSGAFFSPGGDSFTEISDYQTGDASSITQVVGWLGQRFVTFRQAFTVDMSSLRLTGDGLTWEVVALPLSSPELDAVNVYASDTAVLVTGYDVEAFPHYNWVFSGSEWRPIEPFLGQVIDSHVGRYLVADGNNMEIFGLTLD